MSTPVMIVVAGPAGSGKSQLYHPNTFDDDLFPVAGFSVDDRCAEMNGGSYVGITPEIRQRAGRECEEFIHEQIAAGRSFAVETTLRTQIALDQARAARRAGFLTEMIFIGTDDVATNVERIRLRGLAGGHAAPAAEIRAIHDASMANLRHALNTFDRLVIFDNSRDGKPAVAVAAVEAGHVEVLVADGAVPAWVRQALQR